MHKALLAQELLSLTTDRERAGSIAGDLTEEAAYRGSLWFWSMLGGVTFALFYRAFGLARIRTFWLLCRGLTVWAALYIAIRLIGAVAGIEPLSIPQAEFVDLPMTTQAYLAATLMLSSLLAGLALGSVTRANQISGAAPLAMFWAVSIIVAPGVEWLAGTGTWYCTLLYVVGLPLCYLAPLLLGGALAGRRAAPATQGVRG